MQVLHEDEINSGQRCEAGYGQLADSWLHATTIGSLPLISGELLFRKAAQSS
jgi:hypothetical protein